MLGSSVASKWSRRLLKITPNFVKAHLFGIDVVIILRSKYGGNSKKSRGN